LKDIGSGIRLPVVAGYFYPLSKIELLDSIASCFQNSTVGPNSPMPEKPTARDGRRLEHHQQIHCFVVPHAGYEYSGPVAAHSYLKISSLFRSSPNLCVITLGPNHYGLGSGVALSPSSAWQTPLGLVQLDHEISEELSDSSDMIDSDSSAHSREHSIEVQLPFLQAILGKFSFVPICMMMQDNITSEDIADAVKSVILSEKFKERDFLILASSDLTHYEPQRKASEKDQKALRKICELDVNGFYTILERDNVTACGYGPIACAMRISKAIGAKKGDLLKYATSGDVTGDFAAVVGYSAVHFT
jgi:MEMO1 family protein